MRKITKQATDAFVNGYGFNQSNTSVCGCGAESIHTWFLKLHNNLIAEKEVRTNTLTIRDAGWTTPTTKERLNAVLDRLTFGWSLYQKDFEWYLTDGDVTVKWQGSAIFRAGNLVTA